MHKIDRFIVVLKRTDFSPWNFRSAYGFTFSNRPKLENIAVLRCCSFFSRGRSCFSPRPGLCGAARRAMEFWGRDIPCVCREVCSIRGQICAKSQPQRISGKALPPRNFGFPLRRRLFIDSVHSVAGCPKQARYFNLGPTKKQPGAHCARLFPVDFTGLTPFCTSVWGGPPCRTRSPLR